MQELVDKQDLAKLAGTDLEPTSWLEITQDRIDQFADATNDHQFIHVDPALAAKSPLGCTISHGYLTLSLATYFGMQSGFQPKGLQMALNYGSDKVRYLAPVPVGARIRALQKIIAVMEKRPDQYLITTGVTIEIEGQETPALVAEILVLYIVD